jgi:hypothetical protein
VSATTTGDTIAALLDAVGWTQQTLRNLDAGDAINFTAPEGNLNALQQVEALLEAERGVFYIAGDGTATYESRSAITQRRVPLTTITNGALDAEPGFEIDRLVNRQTVQRTDPDDIDGIPQVATNEASLETYGLNDGGTITTPYLASDNQAALLATYLVNLKGQLREPLRVRVEGEDAYAVLGIELQDRVLVADNESGTTGDYHIERIEHTVSEFGLSHSITFTLSPRGLEGIVFSADSASPGEPDYGSVFDSTTDRFTY